MKKAAFIAAVLAASGVHAQSVERIFQSAITRDGKACAQVTDAQAIGTVEGGDALIAVACSDGRHHVVRIHSNDSVSYVSTCGMLEAMAKKPLCFQ